MRDFELLRMPRGRSEVDEQRRTSTIYCRTETGNFKGGGPAGRDRERGVPAPCIGGIGVLSQAAREMRGRDGPVPQLPVRFPELRMARCLKPRRRSRLSLG